MIKNDGIVASLEDSILSLTNEIEAIECQLSVNEIDSTGSDYYFDWRKRAITAKTKKYKQLRVKQLKLKQINREISTKNVKSKKSHGTLSAIMHEALLKSHKDKDLEKTKRHMISEKNNATVFGEFKRLVKLSVGEERYIELIREADSNVNKH